MFETSEARVEALPLEPCEAVEEAHVGAQAQGPQVQTTTIAKGSRRVTQMMQWIQRLEHMAVL